MRNIKKASFAKFRTGLGPILYTHSRGKITSVWFGSGTENRYKKYKRLKSLNEFPEKRHTKFEKEMKEYLAGKRHLFTVKTDTSQTGHFTGKVLGQLKKIKYGTLTTYRSLASRISKPKASRAVGNAVGANPCPILIPCHRVIRSDGSLGGFGCGLKYKRHLLKIEMPASKF